MKRRTFLATAALTAAMTGCSQSETKQAQAINVNKNKKVRLKLATSWPAHFPIMGTGVERFVERVKKASGGSLIIKLYPKNTLVPDLAVFDAASAGQIDAFHSGPYYWKGKNSAFALFSGTPFGFTAEEINAWMLYGGGYTLWRELYARHNLYPLMGGNTNVQMGGWFRKPIESLSDLQGLKMRMPGLGGEVFAKLGVNPVLLPAGDIYSALERSNIDATEWVGPALDIKMGFHKVAKYYYSGWHEPGSILELTFNKYKWDKLSPEHQTILEMAACELNNEMAYEFAAQNAKALLELQNLGVTLKTFPQEVTLAAKKALTEVIEEQSRKNEDFKRVYESAHAFLTTNKPWANVGVRSFLNTRD